MKPKMKQLAIKVRNHHYAVACACLLLVGGTSAQEDASFNKKFPDGSEVYLHRESFVEQRSRPQDSGAGKPGEASTAKEFNVDRYSLFLRTPKSASDILIWSKELVHLKQNPELSAHKGRFRVADVLLERDRAYVLTHIGDFYIVSNVRRDLDGVWFEASKTNLARDLEFQPIVKAEFQPGSKPRINVDYKASGGKYDGLIRRWSWALSNDCWYRK